MKNIELLKNNGVDLDSSIKLLGSLDFYDETINEFLKEINSTLIKIKYCKEQNDWENYSILVHGLKSDSKYLGFSKLAKLASEHESASKNKNIQYIYEHYNELMMEIGRLFNLIKLYKNPNASVINKNKDAIIVADDSNIICNFISKVFLNSFETLTAKDGNEVISIIKNNKDKNIVALFLDLNMPNVSGIEVLEYLNENNLFEKIPVSIITGDDTKDTINKVFEYPIIDVLSKPFNQNDVKRLVDRTLVLHNLAS